MKQELSHDNIRAALARLGYGPERPLPRRLDGVVAPPPGFVTTIMRELGWTNFRNRTRGSSSARPCRR